MTSETDPEMDPQGQPSGVIDGAIAIAKGMGTVWKQTFRRDNTESYPTEIVPPPERSHIGRHQLNTHENGLEKCIGCELVRVRVPGGRDLGGGRRTTIRRIRPLRGSATRRTTRSTTCAASCAACASRHAPPARSRSRATTTWRSPRARRRSGRRSSCSSRRRSSAPTRSTGRAGSARGQHRVLGVRAHLGRERRSRMLVMRNAVHAALFLIVNFFCLARLLPDPRRARSCSPCRSSSTRARSWCCSCSCIMLLGVDGREDLRERRLIAQRPVAIALGVAFVLEVTFAIRAVDRLLGARARPGSTRSTRAEHAGAREGAVQQVLLPVRGDVDPARSSRRSPRWSWRSASRAPSRRRRWKRTTRRWRPVAPEPVA